VLVPKKKKNKDRIRCVFFHAIQNATSYGNPENYFTGRKKRVIIKHEVQSAVNCVGGGVLEAIMNIHKLH